ncbi:MAG: glycosyltransferase family 4 protein [Nitrospiraceae bacterium]|nr:glycosyltransferase family 4 protein [Nitrospiraceae bacterium]MDA8388822.1 glycosyltransferase family 4 protein [Nitrospiraceae bacterium]
MQNKKICMMTTAHGPFDDRIFHKEGLSLVRKGYRVVLIAPHDKNETVEGIQIVPLRGARGRTGRFFSATLRAYLLGSKVGADVYHIHDPELLAAGVLLKMFRGKKVIYDAHEDYGKKILSKKWIGKAMRPSLSKISTALERTAARLLDYVIAADSNIERNFNHNGGNAEVIGNYPPLDFMVMPSRQGGTDMRLIYIGGIDRDRGSKVMVEMMKHLDGCQIELHIAGNAGDMGDMPLDSSGKVIYHGFIPWRKVNKCLAEADVGLLLLQPTPSYVNCTGEGIIKLFEYMLMGLPVIASDFPHLRELITGIGCGICVDPTNPARIADAVKFLFRNPDIRKEMGVKGRTAVIRKYNWENESRKLIAVYQKTLGQRG